LTSVAIRSGWRKRRFGELFRVKHGYAFKGEYFSKSGRYVLLTPGNFYDEGGFREKGENEKYYTGEIPPGYVLKQGDLIVAMTEQAEGLLGSPAIIPKSNTYLHNQRLGLITDLDKNEIDKKFLYYLFNFGNVRAQIRATASGVKVRHTSPERIYQVEVYVPSIAAQRKIAAILSTYDDLIENNTKRIKILEKMAQSIYREWFVHYRFPGHQEVRMVDSSVGKIPDGWAVRTVADIANIHRGKSYKGEHLATGGIPFLNLKCINRDGGFRIDGLKQYKGPFKQSQTARTGDIIIAVTDMTQERRIVARAALVPRLNMDFAVFSMDLVKIEPKDDMPANYLYGMFRFSTFSDEVKKYANGVNVLHLNPERIGTYSFACPPVSVCRDYENLVKRLYEQQNTLIQKNDVLRQARDLLFPRLMSGEVDASELNIGGRDPEA